MHSKMARATIFGLMLVGALVLCTLIGTSSVNPNVTHVMLGCFIIFLAIGIGIGKPKTALYIILIYLPFMGLIRRYLMVHLGALSLDPFVLIEPVVVILLGSFWFYRYLVTKNIAFEDTKLFQLIRWFIFLELLEVGNPLQHGITVGLSGLIFYLVPLFWMVLSREYFSEKVLKGVVYSVFAVAIIIALYGLKQTYMGFYPFEQKWFNMVGYTALYVGNKVRAFSTPDNAQEYAVYLSLGIAIAWVFILKGKFIVKAFGLLGMCIIAWALFMESGRGPIVLSVFAIGITSVLSMRTVRSRLLVSMISAAVISATFVLIGHMAVASQNALVSHQLNGLAHPFNGKDSSLNGHSQRMFSGIIEGFKVPIGHGLGSTTTGASKFNGTNQGTEVDVSNVFVSDGVVGGLLYLWILAQSFFNAVRNLQISPFFSLIAIGVLVAGAGQLLNGQLYSTAAVAWVLIGYVDRVSITYERQIDAFKVAELAKHNRVRFSNYGIHM